jgi:hypothetical protein
MLTNTFVLIVLFATLGLLFSVLGFSGIAVAVAVPFTTKVWLFFSMLCFFIAVVLFLLEKYIAIKRVKQSNVEIETQSPSTPPDEK